MSEFIPLKITGQCVMPDNVLYEHMDDAIRRGYQEVKEPQPANDQLVALVASGPSVAGQLEKIKEMSNAGVKIVAIKDAHDWLIDNGVIPHFALAIDPQEHRWDCFKRKHKDVCYTIASQCHPKVFDHLEGMNVLLWHPYITLNQKRPQGRCVIGGGTTSGLRAISLFYVLGYRHFALFGYDSCMDGETLRVNGSKATGEAITEIRIDKDGPSFYCNPAMALQAEQFQDYFNYMPDASFYCFGGGLISAIIDLRQKNFNRLKELSEGPKQDNERVSFIHWMNKDAASYRYRAFIPAQAMGAVMNDFSAGTLIFTKPQQDEIMKMAEAIAKGATVVVDICDDHLDWPHYKEAIRIATVVTCPTEEMAKMIKKLDRDAVVIPDPYEYPLRAPHVRGDNLLWYGNRVNRDSLKRILPDLEQYPLRVVSNFDGAIPWSYETMLKEFAKADIVVIPATEAYKSANRAIEAIRQGCYVVAEPHPAVKDIPGIWIGNIKEGIEWTKNNLALASSKLLEAQQYVTEKYSPQICSTMWRKAIKRPIT